jgi:hypothetical protein
MGPSFRSKFVNPIPASNADIGITAAHILGLKPRNKGNLVGRILSETLKDGANALPKVKQLVRVSLPSANGLQTMLRIQSVGDQMYFDAAGFSGRTIGLTSQPAAKTTVKSVANARSRRK